MKPETIKAVCAELDRARKVWPSWPRDVVHQASIVTEEVGELVQAANRLVYCGSDYRWADMRREAIETIVAAVRLLEGG